MVFNPFLTPPDYTPIVTFDLGGIYDVQTTRIWQFNQSPYAFTVYGAADIELSFSSDGTNFTPTASDFYPNRAGGTNGEPAQDLSSPVTGVRYVQLQIWTTFGGAAATGLSGVRFVVVSNTAPRSSLVSLKIRRLLTEEQRRSRWQPWAPYQ